MEVIPVASPRAWCAAHMPVAAPPPSAAPDVDSNNSNKNNNDAIVQYALIRAMRGIRIRIGNRYLRGRGTAVFAFSVRGRGSQEDLRYCMCHLGLCVLPLSKVGSTNHGMAGFLFGWPFRPRASGPFPPRVPGPYPSTLSWFH